MRRKLISRIIALAMVNVMAFTSTDVYAAVRDTEAQSAVEESDEDIIIEESEEVEELESIEGSEELEESEEVEESEELEESEVIEESEELTVSDNSISPDGTSSDLANPRKDSSGVVTWDCVYFGSYPQAEVVADKSKYTAVGSDYLNEGDIIEDSGLYSELQKASFSDNGFAEVTYCGSTYTYKRIKKDDASYGTADGPLYYNWSDKTTYHYFRCEPIRWRVLSVDGSDAFLLADKALDSQRYNISCKEITWEKSTIRSWLNGYGSTANSDGKDYSSNSFIGMAFTSAERNAIRTTRVVNEKNVYYKTDGGNDTLDKVFLLSESEVCSTSYGFSAAFNAYDKCRRSKSSTYAKAIGASWEKDDNYKGNCWWWLRSPGINSDDADIVNTYGRMTRYGFRVNALSNAARPALHIDLSSSLWKLAGTVNSEGYYEPVIELDFTSVIILKHCSETLTVKAYDKHAAPVTDPELTWSSSDEGVATVLNGSVTGIAEGEATITVTYEGKTAECVVKVISDYGVNSPRKDASGKVFYDCVSFGTYPQAEVVADKSKYSAVGSDYLNEGDIIEDSGLYSTLQNASFNNNGFAEVTYAGSTYTYKRIKKGDATYGTSGASNYYNWSDTATYHYFRCEPIKWRVLSVDGTDAFLLADKGLDDQEYNKSLRDITWEKSTVRSWLNGYGGTVNIEGNSYRSNSFIGTAFTPGEKNAIKMTSVVNEKNTKYGTDGGNSTKDKVFLLSTSEVCSTSYGFSSAYNARDKCRRSRCSTYAKAMGTWWSEFENFRGNCYWWLRSPGYNPYDAAVPLENGSVYILGEADAERYYTVRPALHLNLLANVWELAGKANSEGEEYAPKAELNITSANILKQACETLTVTAYDKYGEEDVNPVLSWSSSDENVATVENGVVTGVAEGEATITVTYRGSTSECAVKVVSGYGLRNPRKDASGKVFFDCVNFGSYPQAEVVADKSTYTAIGSDCLSEGDVIEDSGLYSKLKSASFDGKGLTTITYGGSTYTYKRIKKDAAAYTSEYPGYYAWSDAGTYHYFRCEPIKWRVLSVEGNDAFLVADKGLENQKYNTENAYITWEKSTIRSWLNGYGSIANKAGKDYSSNSFIDMAFTKGQKGAIKTTSVVNADNSYFETQGGTDTEDKVFLLSESDVYDTSYGFSSGDGIYDKCRRIKSSTYAKAMGTWWSVSEDYSGNCSWWLRTPGRYLTYAVYGDINGSLNLKGSDLYSEDLAVLPALHINLAHNFWEAAGKINSEGVEYAPKIELNNAAAVILKNSSETLIATVYDKYGEAIEGAEVDWSSSDASVATVLNGVVTGVAEGEATITATCDGKTAECVVTVDSGYGIRNPRKDASGMVFYDCVYFGSYPQAEVVADKSTYTAIGSDYLNEGDIIEDSGLYSELEMASYNDNGFAEVTYGGSKFTYKRMKKGNATHSTSASSGYYNWPDEETYHYFRCEPIKWRVLSVDGSDALLLSDKGLDDQKYNETNTAITWQSSTIRSWLNGYDSTDNNDGKDYSSNSFIGTAFSQSEKNAIMTTEVVNSNNTSYGTSGGYNTEDKVFLLSESEAENTSYRFDSAATKYDKCRRSRSSAYAKAMGNGWSTAEAYRGSYNWWLRTPGNGDSGSISYGAVYVLNDGRVNNFGDKANNGNYAVRPALHMNLSANTWESAGKVNSEGVEYEPKVELSTVSANILLNKSDTLTVKAFDKYGEEDANPELTWSSSDENVATVNKGVVTAISTGPATITVTYQGKTAECVVTVFREKKDPTITLNRSGVSVEKNKNVTLTVSATDEYGDHVSNPTVSWISSDDSVATVNDGEVTGISPGTATITATYKGKTSECAVTVTREKKEVTISLNRTEISVEKNKNVTLTATVTDEYGDQMSDPSVSWSSVDEGVATVDNGTVTGVSLGDTTITATYKGKTAECAVTVTRETKDPTISLSSTSITLKMGKTESLTPTVTDKYGDLVSNPTVSWNCIDTTVATVENGTVRGVSVGETTVKATYQGKTAECAVKIIEADPQWREYLDNTSDTTYVLNLATRQKQQIEELAKERGEKGYKIIESRADKKIATMTTKGVITARRVGTATITVQKGAVEYTITVNVVNPMYSVKTYTMNVDETKVLDYVHGNLKPSFSIPDKQLSKATVSMLYTGVPSVKALQRGTVTVTATVGEGKSARKVTAKVRIYDPQLKLYKDRKIVSVGKTLKASIKYGVKKTDWQSSNPNIATVKNGRIKGIAPGTVVITAVNNGRELKQTITVE